MDTCGGEQAWPLGTWRGTTRCVAPRFASRALPDGRLAEAPRGSGEVGQKSQDYRPVTAEAGFESRAEDRHEANDVTATQTDPSPTASVSHGLAG